MIFIEDFKEEKSMGLFKKTDEEKERKGHINALSVLLDSLYDTI